MIKTKSFFAALVSLSFILFLCTFNAQAKNSKIGYAEKYFEGLAPVKEEGMGKSYGYLDKSGKVILNTVYDAVRPYS